MYATCLFCSGALGRNEAIEHFPVGRRLAFDAAKGRLWVVCPSCKRWNLSPLETRWEAIEEAERAYRDTKLRASTENIGLAKLKEGIELVRIGSPMLPEFAGWRYGTVFTSRLKQTHILGAVGSVAAMMSPLMASHSLAQLLGLGVAAPLAAQILGQSAHVIIQVYRARRGRTRINTPSRVVIVNQLQAGSSQMLPGESADEWMLRLRYKGRRGGSRFWQSVSTGTLDAVDQGVTDLRGEDAKRALSKLIAVVNMSGGKRQVVDDAVRLLTNGTDPIKQILGARSSVGWARQNLGAIGLAGVSPELRLALEITLHENDERRALEGELHELAERWREAEEVAAIADSMFVSPAIDERLNQLRDK